MRKNSYLIGLDVGTVRLGVAMAEPGMTIASPYETFTVDGSEIKKLSELIELKQPEKIVIGYPRNQHGEPTQQTKIVEDFAKKLDRFQDLIVFQDESLTSVHAEEYLKQSKKQYNKGDIDKKAAAIILQDYLETHYA